MSAQPCKAVEAGNGGEHDLAALEKTFLEYEELCGGGEGVEGLYGSLAAASMAAVFADWPGFGADSIMLDVGCGICRPQMQALVQYGVVRSVGVEFDGVKCRKALSFTQGVSKAMGRDAGGVTVLHSSSSTLTTLEPCTHLYLCWQGWHDDDKAKMAALVKSSASVFCVCIVQHKRTDVKTLAESGWPEMQLVRARRVHLVDEGKETLQACTYQVSGRPTSPGRICDATGLLAMQPYQEEAGQGSGGRRSARLRV